jgi:SAM-dependent methyltransferase
MEPAEAQKWEERFRRPEYWAGKEPIEFLREVLPWLPRGTALDVAMGEGRNAVFLAEHGLRVAGVDQSSAALDKAEALGRQRGVRVERAAHGGPVVPPRPGVFLHQADLESLELPGMQFDVVLCSYFLHRPLLPHLEKRVAPGGFLIYETYTLAQLAFEGGPRNPEFLLRPGELRAAFPRLEIVFYREHNAGKGIAGLLAHCPRG